MKRSSEIFFLETVNDTGLRQSLSFRSSERPYLADARKQMIWFWIPLLCPGTMPASHGKKRDSYWKISVPRTEFGSERRCWKRGISEL